MKKISVLIAAASVELRSKAKEAIEATGLASVSKIAAGGNLALQMLEHGSIDLMLIDAKLHDMNYLEVFDETIKRGFKTQIIVLSQDPMASAREAKDRLKHVRLHFVESPRTGNAATGVDLTRTINELRHALEKCAARTKHDSKHESKQESKSPTSLKRQASIETAQVPAASHVKLNLDNVKPHVICIGASTGGPAALEVALSKLAGKSRVPILIVQHMPAGFTESLAGRLQSVSGLPTAEARPGETLENGRIYVAPGDYHMRLVKEGNEYNIHLDKGPKRNSVRPSVDFLFETAAQIFMRNTVAVVLTGMGEDGLVGSQSVKKHGGAVIIQDKESSVVWGMPGAIHDAGFYDAIADLEKCAGIIASMAFRR